MTIAYFSAEIGFDENVKTYSGGLGILAGDTIKAMADLEVPLCAVTLLYKHGYFKQVINHDQQKEEEDNWNFQELLHDTGKTITINIDNTPIIVKIWECGYTGVTGHRVPIYFLDTHLEENPEWAHDLTNYLYVGDRMRQEIVLGIGGVRALRALSYGLDKIEKYHMNEGHSAFLTLELYREFGESIGWDDGLVREKCCFTTHTPIPAGHDKFHYNDFYEALNGENNIVPLHIKRLAGNNELNMTRLALSLSGYHNAVSRKHCEVTKSMFPHDTMDYVTNGVHIATWTSNHMQKVFDKYCMGWREDNTNLNKIFDVPCEEIREAHDKAKKELIAFANEHSVTGSTLKEDVLTIGFARRFIQYKDAELIFTNLNRLRELDTKVQFIFSGKAHKQDTLGKEILRRIVQTAKTLPNVEFIPDYGMSVAKKLVAGCDMWLNTPIPPNEASGTSGMKAAANGGLHFSRLDGWAIEAYEMNGGGFPISEYEDFISNLQYKIIPMFYADNIKPWVNEMKLSIGVSAAYFNTHRMAREYLNKAYRNLKKE